MQTQGFFELNKYENDILIESVKKQNVIVNQFVDLIESKMFSININSGVYDTRVINKFFVGKSSEEKTEDITYDMIYNRLVGSLEYINPFNFESDYVPTKRLIRISFTSASGCHVGDWNELGLVATGVSGELPLLMNRVTDLNMTRKSENQIVRGYYNIVF
jgi:hypothetical protein